MTNNIHPYAKAIYELLENDLAQLEKVNLSLNQLNEIAEKEKLVKKVLQDPVLKPESKINLINKLMPELGQNSIMHKLICLLAEKKKLHYILEIGPEIKNIINEKNHISQIEIISARKLSEQDFNNIKTSLEKSLKQEVSIKAIADENLIAGLIIKTDNYIVDNSLKGRLQKMQQNLALS